MSGRWEDWPPARPIRVDGGIRARSKRGAIGEQWWSRRFISVLESYGMSGRLARGRSYARAGQVVVSEDTARRSGADELRLEPLGPVELKGVARPLPLYQAQRTR